MREIYYSCNAAAGDRRPQTVHATLVAETEGEHQNRYRVTINWDTSHAFQTHAEIAVLDGLVFKPVLHLLAHELPVLNDAIKYATGPVQEKAVRKQAIDLFRIGSRVIERPAP